MKKRKTKEKKQTEMSLKSLYRLLFLLQTFSDIYGADIHHSAVENTINDLLDRRELTDE